MSNERARRKAEMLRADRDEAPEHTQGPWRASVSERARGYVCAIMANGFAVADVAPMGEDPASDPVADANAALIAAAPDLLAALLAVESILDGRQPVDVPGAVMVARAAIARAEGRGA